MSAPERLEAPGRSLQPVPRGARGRPDHQDRSAFWPVKAVLQGVRWRLAHPPGPLLSHDLSLPLGMLLPVPRSPSRTEPLPACRTAGSVSWWRSGRKLPADGITAEITSPSGGPALVHPSAVVLPGTLSGSAGSTWLPLADRPGRDRPPRRRPPGARGLGELDDTGHPVLHAPAVLPPCPRGPFPGGWSQREHELFPPSAPPRSGLVVEERPERLPTSPRSPDRPGPRTPAGYPDSGCRVRTITQGPGTPMLFLCCSSAVGHGIRHVRFAPASWEVVW